jgi:hypothetical protein
MGLSSQTIRFDRGDRHGDGRDRALRTPTFGPLPGKNWETAETAEEYFFRFIRYYREGAQPLTLVAGALLLELLAAGAIERS